MYSIGDDLNNFGRIDTNFTINHVLFYTLSVVKRAYEYLRFLIILLKAHLLSYKALLSRLFIVVLEGNVIYLLTEVMKSRNYVYKRQLSHLMRKGASVER